MKKEVVIGFKQNEYGEAVVTTGIPVQYNHDKVSYVKKKTMSYERYLFQRQQQAAKRGLKK